MESDGQKFSWGDYIPQIGPNLWRAPTAYIWWRKYKDGQEEFEIDPRTGESTLWGETTPLDIVCAGWVPVDENLAKLLNARGEFAVPTRSPAILVHLQHGEELVMFKDVTVIMQGDQAWEDVVYNIGIKDKFMIKFNSRELIAYHSSS